MRWIRRLKITFGAPFLILITSIYWTQGFRSLAWMGISYQLKDELKLGPSASQFVISTAFIPWSVKPLYGILSDCVPIWGSRRVSYLVISSLLSFAPWLLLGLGSSVRASYMSLTVLLTVQNFGAAMTDVVIDAMMAEATRKERSEFAGDLQSLSWFFMALGGMLGSVASGFALSTLHVDGIYLLFSVFPLLQLVACGLINERTLTVGVAEEDKDIIMNVDEKAEDVTGLPRTGELIGISKDDFSSLKGRNSGNDEGNENRGSGENGGNMENASPRGFAVEKVTEEEDWVEIEGSMMEEIREDDDFKIEKTIMEGHSIPEGMKQNEQVDSLQANELRSRRDIPGTEDDREDAVDVSSEDKYIKESLGRKLRLTCYILFQAVKQPAIFRPMLWFLISQITIPSLSTIMFYYQTNFLQLDASFLGTARLIGWGALILGNFLYNHYLKQVPLRKIFWWVHIALALITLSDVILVSRINIWLGIPDKAFVLGMSALGEAINQFKFMPFLILSGRLCKPGIEGTLFAVFMSLNNLGGTISSYTGAMLSSSLQISADKFDNFALGIYIQAGCTLLPIFFLSLIPSKVTGVSAHPSE